MVNRITVRLAKATDKPLMLSFLAKHWRKDHIFVQAPEVFDWQYRRPNGDYNVALALDESDDVLGFLGYIPTGHFDPTLGENELMLAIWKVREDRALPGIGVRLLKLIEKSHRPQLIGAIGISEMVGPIYKAFKYRLGSLHHSALFVRNSSIAKNIPQNALAEFGADEAVLSTLTDDHAEKITQLGEGWGLSKSWIYLQNRYQKHPYYRYQIRGIFLDDRLLTVIVWRKVKANGAFLLRIVDVIGFPDGLLKVTEALRKETRDADADYIDLMQFGLDQEKLRDAGFISPSEHEDLVLPNFFAPFERRNVTIELAYRDFKDPARKLTLFRADSDQDRPNLLTEIE